MQQGFDVHIPAMPHPRQPSITQWVKQIKNAVGVCTTDTYFIGHSLGAQAVLRYLATLPEGAQAGGAVCVGGFMTLGDSVLRRAMAHVGMSSWLRTPLSLEAAGKHCRAITAFFSSGDTWVTPDNIVRFEQELGARIQVLQNCGHFTSYERIIALPEVLTEVCTMAGLPAPDIDGVKRRADVPQVSSWRLLWDVVQRPTV